MKPTFDEAKYFKMPWGQYRDKTLDDIASTDKGLLYLDWMRGETKQQPLLDNLQAYLDDPTIAADLRKLARS